MPMTSSRRTLLRSAGGLAGILATARAPAFAQAAAKKMQIAAVNPVPESGAIALDWMAKALTERSKGELGVTYHGGTC
jgi:TRAP-type C4-dicarboxylate transport system substrate-binding protein